MRRVRVLLALAAAALVASCSSAASSSFALLPGFREVSKGPYGGTVWTGRIPNREVAWDHRNSAIYLPPGFSPTTPYPVVYLLHGMIGSPSSFYDGLELAQVADRQIGFNVAAPFIAVMPVAGCVDCNRNKDEWTGRWEDYVVRDVVPWIDRHLPTIRSEHARAIGGISAGGARARPTRPGAPGGVGGAAGRGGVFSP